MHKVVSYAPEAWHMLQGLFCVYKPADMTMRYIQKVVVGNLTRDLNLLEPRPSLPHIVIEGNTAEDIVVTTQKNYADDPLVIGPRYQPKDFKSSYAISLSKNISGVCLLAVNGGTGKTHAAREARLIRTYSLGGKFGLATDTGFHDGKILTKSSHRHITRSKFTNVLMSVQAGFQQSAVHFLGLDPQSQAAYEAMSQEGLIRPGEKSPPLCYTLNLISFEPPDFTIEVSCINENGAFLQNLVHKIGLQLKSNAVCTQIRILRHGPFTLHHALLRKHWTLEHILNNMTICYPLVEDMIPKSPSLALLEPSDVDSDVQR